MHAKRCVRIVAAVGFVAIAGRSLPGQEPATRVADEQAIRRTAAAYVEAVNRGDLEAVANFWTADGDFIDESGSTAKGRALVSQEQEAQRGSKLDVTLNSIRFVTADVAIVEAVARPLPRPATGPAANEVTAVWVRRGERWLLDAVRERAMQPSHHERLREIEWMIGDWQADDDGPRLRMSCRWSADGNFILREIRLQHEEHGALALSQRIGWDPLTRRLKSWTFDDRGGYGESYWGREGDRWVVESRGVLAGGSRISATHVYTSADERTFSWETFDATIDNLALPDGKRSLARVVDKK